MQIKCLCFLATPCRNVLLRAYLAPGHGWLCQVQDNARLGVLHMPGRQYGFAGTGAHMSRCSRGRGRTLPPEKRGPACTAARAAEAGPGMRPGIGCADSDAAKMQGGHPADRCRGTPLPGSAAGHGPTRHTVGSARTWDSAGAGQCAVLAAAFEMPCLAAQCRRRKLAILEPKPHAGCD